MYVLSHQNKRPSSSSASSASLAIEHAEEVGQLHNTPPYNSGAAGETRKEPIISSVNSSSAFVDTLSVMSGRQQRSPPPRSLSPPLREQEQDSVGQTVAFQGDDITPSRSVSVSASAALSSLTCTKTVLVIGPETSRPRFIHNGAVCSYNSPSIFDKLQDPSLYTGVHKHRFDSEGRGRGLAGRDSLSAAGSLLHFGGAGRGGGDISVGGEGSPSPRRAFDKTEMRNGVAPSEGVHAHTDPLLNARARSGAGMDPHIVKRGGGHGDGDSKGTRWATSLRATTHHFTSHQKLIRDGHCRELYRHTSRLTGDAMHHEKQSSSPNAAGRKKYTTTFDIDDTSEGGHKGVREQTVNGTTSSTNIINDVILSMNIPTIAGQWTASPRFDSSTHTMTVPKGPSPRFDIGEKAELRVLINAERQQREENVDAEKKASHTRGGSASIVVDGRNCRKEDEYGVEVGRRKPRREADRRSRFEIIPADSSSSLSAFHLANRSSRLADCQPATDGVIQGISSSSGVLLRPTHADARDNTLCANESTILGIARRVAQLEELNAPQAEDNKKQPDPTIVHLYKYTTTIDRGSSVLTPILEPLVASTLTASKGVEGDGNEENKYMNSNSINKGDVAPHEDHDDDGAPHNNNMDGIHAIPLSTNEQQQGQLGKHQQRDYRGVGRGQQQEQEDQAEQRSSPPRPSSVFYVRHVSTAASTGRVEVTSSELWRASCAVSEGATTGEAYAMAIRKGLDVHAQ